MPELESLFMEYKKLTVENIESFKAKFSVSEQLIVSVKEETIYLEIKFRTDKSNWLDAMKKQVSALENIDTHELVNKEVVVEYF